MTHFICGKICKLLSLLVASLKKEKFYLRTLSVGRAAAQSRMRAPAGFETMQPARLPGRPGWIMDPSTLIKFVFGPEKNGSANYILAFTLISVHRWRFSFEKNYQVALHKTHPSTAECKLPTCRTTFRSVCILLNNGASICSRKLCWFISLQIPSFIFYCMRLGFSVLPFAIGTWNKLQTKLVSEHWFEIEYRAVTGISGSRIEHLRNSRTYCKAAIAIIQACLYESSFGPVTIIINKAGHTSCIVISFKIKIRRKNQY